MKDENGFSLLEVCIASVITMSSLVFLAALFTLAMGQNRHIKQSTSTTMLAQKKIEELMAIEKNDVRLVVGGGLTEPAKQTAYWDRIYADDVHQPTTDIPTGQTAHYFRYWKVEADPGGLGNTVLISVRVVALQPGRGRAGEETTLTTVRSW